MVVKTEGIVQFSLYVYTVGVYIWKRGRVVDGTGLENQQAVTRLVGSNPSASAKLKYKTWKQY